MLSTPVGVLRRVVACLLQTGQTYRIQLYTVDTIIVIIMHGKPNLKNIPNDTGCPFVAQMPAVTRFAPAPTSVPLPPKQAPKASTHASV